MSMQQKRPHSHVLNRFTVVEMSSTNLLHVNITWWYSNLCINPKHLIIILGLYGRDEYTDDISFRGKRICDYFWISVFWSVPSPLSFYGLMKMEYWRVLMLQTFPWVSLGFYVTVMLQTPYCNSEGWESDPHTTLGFTFYIVATAVFLSTEQRFTRIVPDTAAQSSALIIINNVVGMIFFN